MKQKIIQQSKKQHVNTSDNLKQSDEFNNEFWKLINYQNKTGE